MLPGGSLPRAELLLLLLLLLLLRWRRLPALAGRGATGLGAGLMIGSGETESVRALSSGLRCTPCLRACGRHADESMSAPTRLYSQPNRRITGRLLPPVWAHESPAALEYSFWAGRRGARSSRLPVFGPSRPMACGSHCTSAMPGTCAISCRPAVIVPVHRALLRVRSTGAQPTLVSKQWVTHGDFGAHLCAPRRRRRPPPHGEGAPPPGPSHTPPLR